MRIAVLVPYRNDRPEFFVHLKWMIAQQTMIPDMVLAMDHPAKDDKYDITERYRLGYDILSRKTFDLIVFMEVDDWYSKYYIQWIVAAWERAGSPDMFGLSETIFFHLKSWKYELMIHHQRGMMMNTVMKPDLQFTWPQDSDPYTDSWLWDVRRNPHLTRELYFFRKTDSDKVGAHSIGIKHGIGKVGTKDHTELSRFPRDGAGFLEETVDTESILLYLSMNLQLNP